MQKAVSVLSNDDADDVSDVETPLLNQVVVSMLVLPLLQIVSLPQSAAEHCDGQQTVRDSQTIAKQLLSVVCRYASQHPRRRRRHGDASAGSLLMLPSVASHSCSAYVGLARHLSLHVPGNADDDVVGDWLQQVHDSLSTDLQPSALLTLLVTSLFLIHDDTASVDKCLQLLLAICQSDKTQVCL